MSYQRVCCFAPQLYIVVRLVGDYLGKVAVSLLTSRCIKGVSILSLLATGLLTGCSTQPENFSELPTQKPKPEHISQLSSWIYPPAEAEEARRGFVERCVKQAGGSYKEAVLHHDLEDTVFTGRTTEELKETGYGSEPADKSQQIADFDQKGLDAYIGTDKAEQFQVTFMDYTSGDISADGCLAQSYEYIYGSAENGIKVALLAPQFGQAISEELNADQTYIDLQNAWKTCMNDAGITSLESTDQAVYQSSLVDAETAEKMLKSDISCRESNNFDGAVTELKHSYYESMYKRLKQFSDDIEEAHQLALERVNADKAEPKDTSSVTVPTTSSSPSAS